MSEETKDLNSRFDSIEKKIDSISNKATVTDKEENPRIHLQEKYQDFHEVMTEANLQKASKNNPNLINAIDFMSNIPGARYKSADLIYKELKRTLTEEKTATKVQEEKKHDIRKASGNSTANTAPVESKSTEEKKFNPVNPNSYIDRAYSFPTREDRTATYNAAAKYLKNRNKVKRAEAVARRYAMSAQLSSI